MGVLKFKNFHLPRPRLPPRPHHSCSFATLSPMSDTQKKKLPTLWLDFVKKNPAQASKNRVLITKTKNRTNIHGIYNISIKYPMSHTMDI
jgi:hypothetical protein